MDNEAEDQDNGADAGSGNRFGPIAASPAYKLVADAIERQIVSGRVRPGEAIGTEADLVKQFGVNRSTVREGIRLLEQGGLIRRDSSRRLYASVPRYDRLATRISRAFVLHEVTFRELWEATMAIESAVVELAADRISEEGLGELDLNLRKSRAATDKPSELAILDIEFHTILCKAAGNRVLQLAREPENKLFFPTTEMLFQKNPQAARRNVDAHGAIVAALHRRDKADALLWMKRHVNDWKKGFELIGKSIDEPIDRVYAQHVLESNL
ncbi:FadR/GntR family transcriptional regulator [Azospirillum agricola]|uniref:FadR/GntR family transcriptional regulator n=1 Tax=Azospirillum agricola TaxID=1720247 RepID=UPI000A1CC56B|nr:FCD domain-containing protein [Azospirillum agricola]